jgi:hypothetical protein
MELYQHSCSKVQAGLEASQVRFLWKSGKDDYTNQPVCHLLLNMETLVNRHVKDSVGETSSTESALQM